MRASIARPIRLRGDPRNHASIIASVKVWALAPSATCACVPLPAVTMCVVWTAARNAPVFVWGAVRAGSWNTPVGAACGAAREGGRRGPSTQAGGVCA